MAALVIDPMSDASQWLALESDGATPSTELSMADESEITRFGADNTSGRVQATTSAVGHLLRRTFAPIDLSAHDELRLSVRADRLADGAAAPFFLEVRLGSAALPVDDPGNLWQRLLPIARANAWETQRLTLEDASPAVRSAVSLIQLRCVDATQSFTVYIDDVIAVREEMVADADEALRARLDGGLVLSGSPVPAVVEPSGSETSPAAPSIRIAHFATCFSDERTSASGARGDFTSEGYRVRPSSFAYDLFYAVEALAATRLEQAKILDFVLKSLGPRGTLQVAGDELPVDLVWPSELDRFRVCGPAGDRMLLYLRVQTRQQAGSAKLVRAVRQLNVATDFQAQRGTAAAGSFA